MVQKRDHEERNMIGYNQYTQGYNKLFTQVILFLCWSGFGLPKVFAPEREQGKSDVLANAIIGFGHRVC